MRRLTFLTGAVVLLGCPSYRPPETELLLGTSSASTGQSAESTGTTVDEVSSSSGAETTGSASAGSGAQTGDGNRLVEACADLCAAKDACNADVDADVCELACEQDFVAAAATPGCVDARLSWVACLSQLECVGLAQVEAGDADAPCETEAAELETRCDPTCAVVSSMANPGEQTCSIALECGGGSSRAVDCEGEECVCLIDGVEDATCEQWVVCGVLDGGQVGDLVRSCCSWDVVE